MRLRLSFASVILLFAALSTFSQPATPSNTPLFADAFKGKLAEGWTWVHQATNANAWTIAGDGLRIKSLPGTLWLTNNNAKNLLLRLAPEAAGYSLTVTVNSQPTRNGEQGGLLLYLDDDSYIKVVREFYGTNLHLIFAREEAGNGKGITYLPQDVNPVVLRLTVGNTNVTAAYRKPDSKDWTELGTCEPLKKVAQVGVFTHGGDPRADRTVQYNNFEIRTIK